ARTVALQAGFERVISFDMGGTSTDVALLDGRLPQTQDSYVGGLPVRLPSIDIHTVGAGGGSLARLDAGGALRVGPQSAGADPGPACYGRGEQPTVTDANVLLGRLRPDAFLGGAMVLDVARAEAALQPLATGLGLHLAETAQGVIRVANAAMERAIRAISVERGSDPRAFVLVAFGGAGPLHAAYLAEALGMRQVLIPRYPGVLSALGMLAADVTRDSVQFLAMPLAALDPAMLTEQVRRMAQQQGYADLRRDAGEGASLVARFTLDLRYRGQSHEINTPLLTFEQPLPDMEQWALPAATLTETTERFHSLHRQYSGHAMPDRPIETVALRLKLVASLPRIVAELTARDAPQTAPASVPTPQPVATVQAALARDDATLHPTAIYEREHLTIGTRISGPAIVVQFDTTTVIPPRWQATSVAQGHLLLKPED
ncbi:MAG: hydantoinase/oxoprolinase family protein, partial [Chloroflexaceae bacterium]|nr:hydantoinase/oxoprolinase family protein [Chloroflexaceae bacterium]